MPRKPNLDAPVRLGLNLPTSVRERLDIYLFSELEGKVPKGKYGEFFTARTVEFFENRHVDLGMLGFPPGSVISGSKETIELLLERLKK